MSMKQLVQQQRDELYASGHRNLNMALSEGTIQQIDLMKKRYRLRSRDQVVARVIRKCSATVDPDSFVQHATSPATQYRRISPIIAGELADYVKQVQRRFRNIGYGPVFEMIFAEVGTDLSNTAVQLELIRSADP
ncbi:hypothetical protein ASE22_25195 [Sphingomonas sp. Root720]|nr:hypothetical protein ASE00_21425 [Sphingomonas sp. Root710]KRB93702.1 hypothetical protein ASE22_25195 [Sphingomonas sp. Root720]